MRQNMTGWVFVTPAVVLLIVLSIIPLVKAFLLSLQTGRGSNLTWAGLSNYVRMLQDPTFKQTIITTFEYMVFSVPIMIILGIILAVLLNDQMLKLKGIYRTCIFLPAAVSLGSYFPLIVCDGWFCKYGSRRHGHIRYSL